MEAAMIANIIMLLIVGGVAWYVNTRIKSQKKHANTTERPAKKEPDYSNFKRRVS